MHSHLNTLHTKNKEEIDKRQTKGRGDTIIFVNENEKTIIDG